MPISGLLLTLSDPSNPAIVRDAISALCDAEFGELQDRWLPIAVDTTTQRDARDLHDELMSIPGISYIDVVSVAFDGDSDLLEPSPLTKATRSR